MVSEEWFGHFPNEKINLQNPSIILKTKIIVQEGRLVVRTGRKKADILRFSIKVAGEH